MKDWNLIIRGVGPSQSEGDASLDVENLAREFIAQLRALGHEVRCAEVTPGQIDLMPKEEA